MDNIRTLIKALYLDMPMDFCRTDTTEFIKKLGEYTRATIQANNKQNTDSETGIIVEYAQDQWLYSHDEMVRGKIFMPLLEFAKEIVLDERRGPVVRFSHLLRWQQTTALIGEDIFTTIYFADRDLCGDRFSDRTDFNWPLICPHDHARLNEITHRGLPELHFHLKGSSANYELSWLCLMNNTTRRKSEFAKLKKYLYEKTQFQYIKEYSSLHELCLKAASIRLYFYHVLKNTGRESKLEQYLCENIDSNYVLSTHPSELQQLIDEEYFIEDAKRKDVLDYALFLEHCNSPVDTLSKLQKQNTFVAGERRFMYNMFQGIMSGQFADNPKYTQLFYTYLLIKSQFRKEFIQINQNIGFDNFSNYEQRKELFLEEYPPYADKLINYAINGTLAQHEVNYLEARITPKDTVERIEKRIANYRKIIESDKDLQVKKPYHYILHYIKKPSKYKDDYLFERNFILREQIKQESMSLVGFKQRNNDLSDSIIGIDAANSELACRPEVFAQAFRYLQRYQGMNYTFHAGEDYYDIVDGLRAIDETIAFLNFKRGDRIGHALALGADAEAYYSRKHYLIAASKQNMLDNMVWIYCKSGDYGVNKHNRLRAFLKEEIVNLALGIGYKAEHFTINSYYSSMKLRGDNPWADQKHNTNQFVTMNWDAVELNQHSSAVKARQNEMATGYYQQYHFDPKVRKNGQRKVEIKFPKEYSSFVTAVQEVMMQQLDELHIGIECNPTSNVRIGGIGRYEDHPIFRFFSDGIADEGEPVHSLSVSINTDDQGVFATSLPNEYALLAAAMEKKKDKDGNPKYSKFAIYRWIDNVRLSAIGQKFVKGYDEEKDNSQSFSNGQEKKQDNLDDIWNIK